jgi:hypothetical protein
LLESVSGLSTSLMTRSDLLPLPSWYVTHMYRPYSGLHHSHIAYLASLPFLFPCMCAGRHLRQLDPAPPTDAPPAADNTAATTPTMLPGNTAPVQPPASPAPATWKLQACAWDYQNMYHSKGCLPVQAQLLALRPWPNTTWAEQ